MREAAEDLSGKMADTVGRFERVGSALQEWVPHLEHAQDVTLIALRRAQEAEHQQAAYAPSVVMGPPSPEPTTDAQVAAERRRVGLHDEAAADLHAARARFDEAVDEHHSRARAIAARLEDAAHDQLTDSGWEQFKGWVHQHADTIKKITELLSGVTTFLAALALLVPGINIGAFIVLGLLVLAGHSALAASGDGSWADVALDGVGLLTLGLGAFAAGGIKGVQLSCRAVAAKAEEQMAKQELSTVNNELRHIYVRSLRSRGRALDLLTARQSELLSRSMPSARAAATRVLDAPLPKLEGGMLNAVRAGGAGGDIESAARLVEVKTLALRYGEPAMEEAVSALSQPVRLARAAYFTSTAVDVFDKLAGSSTILTVKPYWASYDAAKAKFVHEWGGSW